MSLESLPTELHECVSEHLEPKSINAIARASKRLRLSLNKDLYRFNVQQSGSSALLWAAQRGQKVTAKRLLEAKANIQATNDLGEAALYLAAQQGDEQFVELLLDADADVNAQGGHYGNALQVASAGGHKVVVKLLFDNGAVKKTKKIVGYATRSHSAPRKG